MADLTTLANVKAWMAVSGNADDVLLARLITAASAYIESWLNRRFAIATYSELRDGSGADSICVKNYPITSVQNVTINGVPIVAASGPQGMGYLINDSGTAICLRGYAFLRDRFNVSLTYTAGFSAIPPDVEQACIDLVSLRYKERDRIGQISKSLAGETVAFSQKDLSEATRTLLNNYKRVILL